MMNKSETIAEIMRLNPSVGATFLSEFPNDDLLRYLKRLRELRDGLRLRGAVHPREHKSSALLAQAQTV